MKVMIYQINENILRFKDQSNLDDFLKTRIESLHLSKRSENALIKASVRSVGGIVRKKIGQLEKIDGLGRIGVKEIERQLLNLLSTTDDRSKKISPYTRVHIVDTRVNSSNDQSNKESLDLIISHVADYFKVDSENIIGKNRRANVVIARDVLIYILRELCKMSFPSIGRMLGGRDHTTIIYATNKIKQLSAIDPYFRQELQVLLNGVKTNILDRTIQIDLEPISTPPIKILLKEREITPRNAKILKLYLQGLTDRKSVV